MEKTLNIHNCLSTPLQDVVKNINDAFKEYWKVKKDAKTHRLTYLEDKANNIAEENGNDVDNIYKQLITREA